jgi:DNA ligase D-like protein (predicted 3'-phosphoesterase)
MSKNDLLQEYREKRDFRRTAEPKGGSKSASEEPIFVIQKHDASNLHYDFRLEIDGVLKSWAVPKGPSTDPSEKRLAISTEDHPLEYADFEGIIPEGEYGAGAVIIWDRGPYRNLRDQKENEPATMSQSIESGHIEIWLEGEKIQGGYALIRTGQKDEGRWLLVKMDDQKADARRNPTSTEPKSVLSGQTLDDIREDEGEN